jgi:hypothetical protein
MNSVEISWSFFGMMAASTLLIINLYNMLPHWATGLVLAFLVCISISFAVKGMVLAGDRDMNTKDVTDILVNNSISVLVIVGLTVAFISNNNVVGRAFENTVGYMWISWFNGLSDVVKQVFTGSPNYNYNIIVTQLFDCIEPNGQKQIDNYLTPENFPFKEVTINRAAIDTLKELVTKKRHVSEATLISLATIVAAYIGYLPIVKPWVR